MRIGVTAVADPVARTAALLDARAAALAARKTAQERQADTVAYLVCACGPERYGLPLGAVAGVGPERPCTALPNAPPALRGITAVAGVIVSVLDLATCLGLGGTEAEGEGGHMVSLRAQEPPVALRVDRVIGIARIDAGLVQSADRGALGRQPLLGYAPPGSDGTGDVGEGFSLVDLPALLTRFMS
ncbi:MAG TPA: chemotaxis protein CheW [Methylorubrum populi]|uniref:Chemotaxis protein CheW n=1 Tax=Methylorubrum populi TaxID=223967 RepID=A0A921E7R8_9HYPH|nr:chemotaxis protein CheW [Methylorubrum populi]